METIDAPLEVARERAAPVVLCRSADGARVSLHGRLDTRTVADVRLALFAIVTEPADGVGELWLDLDDVLLGDATAVGLLVEAHRRARRAGRRLVLGELTPRTERLLRAVRLLPPRGRAGAAGREVGHVDAASSRDDDDVAALTA